jgi:two-component sensor histidine kinase
MSTKREEAEAGRELLIAELNHRVKNTLSVVQSIAHQTFRETETTLNAREAFDGRLVALALAHNLLTQLNWERVSLEQIARVILNVTEGGSGRIRLSGPAVLLPPKEALVITMALHELCTNAMKYGSLSNKVGQVDVEWMRSAGARLKLAWRESGGPCVSPPRRRGFGSRLLERSLASDLDGEVQLAFEPSGLVCLIDAPLATEGGARR